MIGKSTAVLLSFIDILKANLQNVYAVQKIKLFNFYKFELNSFTLVCRLHTLKEMCGVPTEKI